MADDRPRFSGRVPASGAPLNARTLALRPGGQSFEQGDLTSSDAVANAVYRFLQSHPGLGVPEQGQQNLAETARTVEQNTPWGQGEEAIKSARSGDLPGTVSGIFGATPILGAAAGVGAKVGKAAAKDAAETVASTIAKRAVTSAGKEAVEAAAPAVVEAAAPRITGRLRASAAEAVPLTESGGGFVAREAGQNIGAESIGSIKQAGHFYRGMTQPEYQATLGAGGGVKSSGAYSLKGEGTSFADNPADAESYINFGRDDPRTTGKPTYLVEVGGDGLEPKPDGYHHAKGDVQPTRVWEMRPEGGAIVAHPVDSATSAASATQPPPSVTDTIVKRARAPKDLPNVTWNPDTQAWEGGPVKGVPMEPPPHVTIPDIYDTKAPELADVPANVPQVELPRYEPPKGPSDRVADLISNAAVRQRMLDSIQQGKDIGMSWHNTQPAIQDAIDALGSEQAGRDAFKRFIDYNAGTSSLNAVPTNLREASYYYYRGANDMGPVEVGSSPPDPYHGGLANTGHQKAVNAILGGIWGEGDVAKTPSYGANLEGNLTPVAMDRHAIRAPGMMTEDPRWLATQVTMPDKTKFRPQDEFNAGNLTMEEALKRPTYWTDMPLKNEYAPLEDYYQSLAKDAGMAPGQAQASGWVGNAELTGVDTDPSKTFLDMYQDRIKNTAYRTGKDPKDVVRGFWQGQHPLLAVPAAAAGVALPAAMMQQNGQETPATPGLQASIAASPGFQDWWQQLQNQKFASGNSSTTPT